MKLTETAIRREEILLRTMIDEQHFCRIPFLFYTFDALSNGCLETFFT